MCGGVRKLGEREGWAFHEKRAFAHIKFHSSKVFDVFYR